MMDKIFNPENIAVIGASSNKKKLGYLIYNNLKSFNYPKKIFPVNKKKEKIGQVTTYTSILEIPEKVDLAVIVVPAKSVIDVCNDCVQKGVAGAVIISSGFSESGDEGKKLEEKLKKIARESKLRIIGPNCLGIIDTYSSLDASFASVTPKRSNISVFSQSGAVCSAILDWADKENKGFSKFISLGNKADIEESEVLDYLTRDKNTKVILGYLESILFGQKFLKSAKKAALKKPVIVVKSGKTKSGAKAVSSHTGNIAGSDLACDVAFGETGIIRAESLEELFNYAKIFQPGWQIKGKNIAVITNAGGLGVMASDSIEKSHLELARIDQKTEDKLKKHLPKASSLANPIDVLGDADGQRYKKAIFEVADDKSVDALVVVLTPQLLTQPEKTADAILDAARKFNKPIVASFVGGTKIKKAREEIVKNNIPFFDFPSEAIDALEKLYLFSFRDKSKKRREINNYRKKKTQKIIKSYRDKNKKNITEGSQGALDVLDSYNINTAKHGCAKTMVDAAEIAKKIGYPLVLKSSVSEILHKTEIGAVEMDIQNENEFNDAYHRIKKSVEKVGKKDARSVCVYEMKEGFEAFLGAKKDPVFGPMLIFGSGGIYVEVIKDFSYRLAPCDRKEAEKMIKETKMGKVLLGSRKKKKMAVGKLAEIIVNLSNLVNDFPEIKEVDMNPVIVNEHEATAVDAKIILD